MASSSLGYHRYSIYCLHSFSWFCYFCIIFRWWTFKDYDGLTSPASRAIEVAAAKGLTVRVECSVAFMCSSIVNVVYRSSWRLVITTQRASLLPLMLCLPYLLAPLRFLFLTPSSATIFSYLCFLTVVFQDFEGRERAEYSSVGPTADGRIKPEVVQRSHALENLSRSLSSQCRSPREQRFP